MDKNVVIVGGGFGGIRTALDLAHRGCKNITLISDRDHFEYYPGLHKLLGVSHHPVVTISLTTIFQGTSVRLVSEKVTALSLNDKVVTTEKNTYSADYIVLALGSQTEFFGIPGLAEMSYGFKSYADAQRLREHIELMFEKHKTTDKTETLLGLHMIIVGGGPNGVDLAGELATLIKSLAQKYTINPSFIALDLVEVAPRILGMLPESVSMRVEKRLKNLGVNVLCNSDLKKQGSWTLDLSDRSIGTKTLIWTAGVSPHGLIKHTEGFTFGTKGRVVVDEYLQAKGHENIFCIGDIADTPYSGLAQTALIDGSYVARVIAANMKGKSIDTYVPVPNAFNIGVGRRWSLMKVGSFVMYGLIPYIFRTLIDIRFFLSILPFREVFKLYFKK